MNLNTALKIEREAFARRMDLRLKKGEDYANDTDCLQNFKKVAILLSTLDIDTSKSYGVALIYAMLKVDRLCNLIFRQKTDKPKNEAISDTIDDLQNYIDLFRESLKEDYDAD